ncbi:hypothetical protein DFR70_110238 [Nocardia tenerifensis]|uniref:LtfC/p132/Gp6 beta-sandwich domain-containing protein n=1 Tax=Nocardia tenerifensis TaxID=228006 RepID=A0A318K056_9NOCA|nr:hypothetical protein [Nocardia tenerifensis]PXX60396.1 hypothetical protein DFR70_110238 [Nocardia tenerifensis]
MVDYLGYRPNKSTIILSRSAAFTQRFEVTGTPLPNGTTSWIDIYDSDDELLTTWTATTISGTVVDYLIEPQHTEDVAVRTHANYNLYLNYPGTRLPYCWFRGPIVRE